MICPLHLLSRATTYTIQINKPVDKIVVSEVVHSGREVAQNEEPFVLVQAEVVFRIVQQVEQRPTWLKKHTRRFNDVIDALLDWSKQINQTIVVLADGVGAAKHNS